MFSQTHRARKGFAARQGLTLVEVMIAAVIIAILAAIIIPTINRARTHARAVQCMSNLRQIDAALKHWGVDRGNQLPDSGEWVLAVLGATTGNKQILYCPESTLNPDGFEHSTSGASGIPGGPGGGGEPLFHTWQGGGQGTGNSNPNGSRLKGRAPWRTEIIASSTNSYTKTWKYHPHSPSPDLIVTFTRMNGNSWKAHIDHVIPPPPGSNFRTDAILADGTRYKFITTGMEFGYVAADSASTTGSAAASAFFSIDYGFNIEGSQIVDRKLQHRVLVMDYRKDVFDYDDEDTDNNDYSELFMAPRHLRHVNVLLTDSSVQRMSLDNLDPVEEQYQEFVYDVSGTGGRGYVGLEAEGTGGTEAVKKNNGKGKKNGNGGGTTTGGTTTGGTTTGGNGNGNGGNGNGGNGNGNGGNGNGGNGGNGNGGNGNGGGTTTGGTTTGGTTTGGTTTGGNGNGNGGNGNGGNGNGKK